MVTERKNGVQKAVKNSSGLGRAIINKRKKAAIIANDPSLVSLRKANTTFATRQDCLYAY